MTITNKLSYRLTLVACVLALAVVVLGAYTRLTDAGLGCPDWPGCYGHMIVPDTSQQIRQAQLAFPTAGPVQETKAWTEMIHRYIAGTLGLIIVFLAGLALARRKNVKHPLTLPLVLLVLVVFQSALGMWTVTLKLLPVVVSGHLIGGMTILACLWFLFLRLGNYFQDQKANGLKGFRPWAVLGLIIVFLQIALGGWVSANYAALICPHFPFCRGSFFPAMDFNQAFNLFSPIGANYQFGLLDNTARIAIQMVHRYGAILTGVYVMGLALSLIFIPKLRQIKLLGIAALLIVISQISLGILNIEWLLPLPIAVAHNAVAAILLLCMVTINYCLFEIKNVEPKNAKFCR